MLVAINPQALVRVHGDGYLPAAFGDDSDLYRAVEEFTDWRFRVDVACKIYEYRFTWAASEVFGSAVTGCASRSFAFR